MSIIGSSKIFAVVVIFVSFLASSIYAGPPTDATNRRTSEHAIFQAPSPGFQKRNELKNSEYIATLTEEILNSLRLAQTVLPALRDNKRFYATLEKLAIDLRVDRGKHVEKNEDALSDPIIQRLWSLNRMAMAIGKNLPIDANTEAMRDLPDQWKRRIIGLSGDLRNFIQPQLNSMKSVNLSPSLLTNVHEMQSHLLFMETPIGQLAQANLSRRDRTLVEAYRQTLNDIIAFDGMPVPEFLSKDLSEINPIAERIIMPILRNRRDSELNAIQGNFQGIKESLQ